MYLTGDVDGSEDDRPDGALDELRPLPELGLDTSDETDTSTARIREIVREELANTNE